jgi:hypothetical protein
VWDAGAGGVNGRSYLLPSIAVADTDTPAILRGSLFASTDCVTSMVGVMVLAVHVASLIRRCGLFERGVA